MLRGEAAFVDSGAWAREHWDILEEAGARLHTSIPVALETFTFLERNAHRDVALAWKESVRGPVAVKVRACEARDLAQAWDYFRRKDLHKLSAVDATSFAIMKRARIRMPSRSTIISPRWD